MMSEKDSAVADAPTEQTEGGVVGSAPTKEEPKARNRTWSVEITYRSGASDRETVKCPAIEDACALEDSPAGPSWVIQGESTRVIARCEDVARIRISKGA